MDLGSFGYEDDSNTLTSVAGGGLQVQRRNTWSLDYDTDRISKNMYVPRILCRIYDNSALTPDVVTRVVLLESYCLYLTTEYILYIKRFDDDIARVVLGEVHDICNILGVASDEYVVIKLDGTVLFSSVQTSSKGIRKKSADDMVVHNTVIYKLPYFDNRAYITRTTVLCDKDKEILCVITSHTIYILSIDFKALYSGSDSLLGIVSFPSPPSYSKIELPVLNDIHLESPPRDEVLNCSVWSAAEQDSFVCAGNGTWLDVWPISKIDDVWELKRTHYEPIRLFTGYSLTHSLTHLLTHSLHQSINVGLHPCHRRASRRTTCWAMLAVASPSGVTTGLISTVSTRLKHHKIQIICRLAPCLWTTNRTRCGTVAASAPS